MSSMLKTPGPAAAYTVKVTPQANEYKEATFKKGSTHAAAEAGNVEELERLVKISRDPESLTLQQREEVLGMMPIHIAAERGHLGTVEYLIKKRVDLDACDNFRVTALHLASIEGRYDVVKRLLESRANPKAVENEGDLPIHWAATKGQSKVIELLVRFGSSVDPVNKSLWTPLHRAAYNGRRETCVTLVNLGADLKARNKDGNTPLHLACFMNQLSVIEDLLGLAAPTDAENNRGQRPLELCITDAARDMVGRLTPARPAPVAPERPPTPPAGGQQGAGESAIDELSAKLKDTALARALRDTKARAGDFPDAYDAGVAQSQDDLAMRASGLGLLASDFLAEAAGGGGVNPYSLVAPDGERSSRSSLTSLDDRSSISSSRVRRSSYMGGGDRPSASRTTPTRSLLPVGSTSSSLLGAGGNSGSLNVSNSGAMALGTPRPRPAAVSLTNTPVGGSTGSAVIPTAVSARKPGAVNSGGSPAALDLAGRLSADEYQQKVKEENRRAAAAAGVERLLGGDATAGKPRPISGNKKFLQKYDLHKLNLFAP